MAQNRTPIVRLAAAVSALLGVTSGALAQLTPDRLYYGVDRKAPMTVAAPEGGDAEIRLLAADGSVVKTAAAAPGGVDLAALFPIFWETSPTEVYFAQLVVDGSPLGPAVVIDPMISVDKARMVDPNTLNPTSGRGGKPMFESDIAQMRGQGRPPVTYSGFRAYVDKDVVMETSEGTIRVRLRPDIAPNHAWNFRQLVDGGYYTEILFHRVIPAQNGRPGFVIQVGDPTGLGSGGPGYQIDLEKSSLPHDFGVLSMARTGDPDSGGSQIFICLSREATRSLDTLYTGFGQAIAGADTINAIGSVDVGGPRGDRPVNPPVLIRAYLDDAAPYGTGPAPVRAPGTAGGTGAPEPGDR